MVPFKESEQFFGLSPDVIFRIEIGLAIVDDGQRTFRFPARTFRRALSVISSPKREEASDLMREFLESHESIFVPLPASDAQLSTDDKEV